MINKIKKIAQKYTILYVEDDKNTQKMMENILSMLFKKVIVANDGKEGCEKYTSNAVDLIISDISMPLMSGIEMAKEIRKTNRHIPIVLSTAFSDNEYLFDTIHLGIDGYINKPLNQKNFFSILKDILQRLEDEQMKKVSSRFKA